MKGLGNEEMKTISILNLKNAMAVDKFWSSIHTSPCSSM